MKPTLRDLKKAEQDLFCAIKHHKSDGDGNNVLSELLEEQKRLIDTIKNYERKFGYQAPSETHLHE